MLFGSCPTEFPRDLLSFETLVSIATRSNFVTRQTSFLLVFCKQRGSHTRTRLETTPKRFGKIDTASPTACQLTWSLNNSNQRRDVDRNENHRNFCVLSSFASDYNYAQLSKGFSRATTCDAIFRLNEPYRLVSPTVSSVRFERTARLRTDRR